ncbi:MAG: aldehyde ferredoxin oxidoreductase family protein [Anaerolineae bacterium]|nr:aldehyde ferredoxin oxidoreductase family protein [Anaerolineae bacterium]
MVPTCYNGKILHVDLTHLKFWVEEPGEGFYRTYGGGSAMGMYYILKEAPKGVDPLAPENILTLMVGTATGLPISGQSRMCANARSPLTGAIGDSQVGGFFPAKMKDAGYDGIVLRGKAPRPVYLWINDGVVEFREAGHLWGKTTGEVEDLIKQELDDPKVEVAQVGPAGEQGVRFAAIVNMCNRANGRTGMGAVMGSKNLKAVVVQGKKKIKAHDQAAITRMFREGTRRIPDTPAIQFMSEFGTTGDVAGQNGGGALPTRNFNEGQFEGFETISGEWMNDNILVERDTCYSCTVHCKPVVKTAYQGREVLPRFGGPEYETTATFGSYCAIDDMNAVALANQLCNQYGMDTISCGATISFAMECFEKGIIGLEDTGGLDLRYGNSDTMLQLVEMIGKREGFGDLLAEGSARAAEKIGRGSEACLIVAKSQEAPAHMPQAKRIMGLLYAVNPFGADHMSAEHDPFYEVGSQDDIAATRMHQLGLLTPQPPGKVTPEKARMVAMTQKFFSANETYCLCSFVWGVGWQLYGPEEMAQMLSAASGWDITLDEVLKVGERRIVMMRMFNAREGFTRADDSLSHKFFLPLQGTGDNAGVHYTHEEFEAFKDAYYRHMGWDVVTGAPTAEKLVELGLEWVA